MPSAKLPRPRLVCTALKRLGYRDEPGRGDHIRLLKRLDHSEGPVTIHTGIDPNDYGLSDVARIRKATKLEDDDLWRRALNKKLTMEEYDEHLLSFRKADLLIAFFRQKFG